MKEYKLETLIYFLKVFKAKEHIMEASAKDIQARLDEYAAAGWPLQTSKDFGGGMYFYLYFERDR